MPNAMHGISRFEDAVKLLDAKDAEIARLRKALENIAYSWGKPQPLGTPDRQLMRHWMNRAETLRLLARMALSPDLD